MTIWLVLAIVSGLAFFVMALVYAWMNGFEVARQELEE